VALTDGQPVSEVVQTVAHDNHPRHRRNVRRHVAMTVAVVLMTVNVTVVVGVCRCISDGVDFFVALSTTLGLRIHLVSVVDLGSFFHVAWADVVITSRRRHSTVGACGASVVGGIKKSNQLPVANVG
jgi:hypothetical protein